VDVAAYGGQNGLVESLCASTGGETKGLPRRFQQRTQSWPLKTYLLAFRLWQASL